MKTTLLVDKCTTETQAPLESLLHDKKTLSPKIFLVIFLVGNLACCPARSQVIDYEVDKSKASKPQKAIHESDYTSTN